jgi:hypothetical protein
MVEQEEMPTTETIKWFRWLWAVIPLMGAMLYLYYGYPEANIGPQQPIYFSHRVHAGVKQLNCRFCHPYVERSEHAGLPTMEKCFYCHKYIIPDHPQLVKEKQHYEAKDPVRWVRLFYVPDFVKFRHQPHIAWGKVDCAVCHGPVNTADRLRQVDFQMGFCINCHKERNAQIDCWLACHH